MTLQATLPDHLPADSLPADSLHIDDETADRLFRQARSVREFSDEEVPVEQVEAAFDLMKWGPTAMNIQPLRLLVLRRGSDRERLVPHMAEGNRGRVATAPLSIVLAADPNFHEHMEYTFPHAAPVREQLATEYARREEMARLNANIQAGYFIVSLRAAGLAAGPMNGMDRAAVDHEFFAASGWKSFMVVNVGTPANSSTPLARLPRMAFADAAQVL